MTWTFFILGLLTVSARVVAGIHYPGDILIGFLLGWSLTAILTSLSHGVWYRKYFHYFPLKIASFFRL